MKRLGVVLAALILSSETAAACFTCSSRIEMTSEQVACFVDNFKRYLDETEVMDPTTINLNNCDGSAGPVVNPDGSRGSTVPPPNCPEDNADCTATPIDWVFLSRAQLICLEPVLIDAKEANLNPLTYDWSTCPK